MNSQTRIQDHVNELTERIVRDLRRHIDSDKLTSAEIVRAERAVAMQLLTGQRDRFRAMGETSAELIELGQELIDRSSGRRFMVEPAGWRDGTWVVRDMESGKTSGSYGSAAAAASAAEKQEGGAA